MLQSKKTNSSQIATLAGGCFWGMEEILRKIPGVLETTVGYIGGTRPNPTYEQVCTGVSGHAEAIEVVFDPSCLSYEAILRTFFKMHDPTTLNRQHNDRGSQYRSSIFFHNEEQREIAQNLINELNEKKEFKNPIVTQLEPASQFYPAEDYHQDYLVKNPGGYNCHILRN